MPIRFQCSSCGKRMRAADNAAGKKTKCPSCGTALRIPETSDDVIYDAEPAFDAAEESEPAYSVAGSSNSSDGKQRRPCPLCGEMIVATAVKCRYCGEVFDPALKKKKKKKRTSSYDDGYDDDMSTGDWIVAIMCAGIGCIAGIVWTLQGKSKGPKMIGVSLMAATFWNVLHWVILPAILGPPPGR